MASFFDFVKAPSLPKYKYDLSHEVKFSGRIGDLIPFNWEFLSPGDSVKLNSSQFVRTAPLVHPIYQRLNVDVHHYFIPLRLIWDEFEDFITGFNQKYGHETAINHPKFVIEPGTADTEDIYFNCKTRGAQLSIGSLADYLGIPVQEIPARFGIDIQGSEDDAIATDGTFYDRPRLDYSLLPFRAYAKVYNDYYRDSIKEREMHIDTSSNDYYLGEENDNENAQIFELQRRALSKDYFTTSQPTPQLGEDVMLQTPIGMQGNLTRFTPPASSDGNLRVNTQGIPYIGSSPSGNVQGVVNFPSAVITTINKLRELFSIQKWKDQGNKFGSRYKEQVLGHFGVETPDARLQRAQFLGGGRIPIMINQVSQLSEGNEDSPLGYQAGQGMASGADNYFEYDAREHGILLSIVSVLPENTYFKGIPKKFKLYDRFDFPFPEFATLGEQEVKSEEMNVLHEDGQTFGYQERYSEFKTIPNRAMGEFRTNLRDFFMASPQEGPSCLDTQNLRVFASDYDNVFAVDTTQADNLYFLIMNDFTKYTPLPYINRVTTDYV